MRGIRNTGRADGYFGVKDWDKVAREDDDDHSGRRGAYDVTDIGTAGATLFALGMAGLVAARRRRAG